MSAQLPDLTADVTVIGAGFAGLVAAALLARDGFSVRVLERDAHPGGCAAAYGRATGHGRFRFAVGATVAAGLEPGGLLDSVFRRLELTPRFRPLDPAIRVHLPDRTVNVAGTRAGWDAELERAFPGNLPAKRRFWRRAQGLADAMHHAARRFPSMPFRTVHDVLDTARGFHPGALGVLLNLNRTVADLLEETGVDDPAMRAFIDGQLLDSMQVGAEGCALPNGAYALEVYRYGAQYVPGGLASLAEDLAASVVAHGGSVHYGTRARRVVVEGGRAVGVEAGGRFYRSPIVVCTAPLPDAAALLGEACPPELQERVAGLPELWGAFTLYLGVREAALPQGVHPFEQVTDWGERGLTENLLVSISPAWDRSRAPEGFRAVTVSTHVRPEGWFGLPKDVYAARKGEMEARLLGRLERLWPGFGSGLVSLESGSPRTWAAFTLHSLGRVGGVPQTPRHANLRAQHQLSGVPGLLLAGETIFPGPGTLGVAVSGHNAYRTACRLLGRRMLGRRTLSRPVSRRPRSPALEKEAV